MNPNANIIVMLKREWCDDIKDTHLYRMIVGKRPEGVWQTATSIDFVVDEYNLTDPFWIKVVFSPMFPEDDSDKVHVTAHFPREAVLGIIESDSETVIEGFRRVAE
jgi:hypothetical protein